MRVENNIEANISFKVMCTSLPECTQQEKRSTVCSECDHTWARLINNMMPDATKTDYKILIFSFSCF